jgi:putative ABC transport system substrate-binding protein
MRVGRTKLVVALALGVFGWSVSAHAQQSAKVPLIGILSDENPSAGAQAVEPFAKGLRDLGYVEGQTITFERRYANRKYQVLPRLATELVQLQPDVIFAVGTPAARAAKAATDTISIVFVRSSDPIGFGLVASLARPGGNLTGLSSLFRELEAKRLELLITAVPEAKRVGVLWEPNWPFAGPIFQEIEGAARSLNLQIVPAEVRGPDDFESAFRAMAEQRASALIGAVGIILSEHRQRLLDLTAKARLPSMFADRAYVEAGALMSYGPNWPDMYRRAAAYVDKILKGAKPADLPVEQPTKFELVINLKTAKSLGLALPYTLLGRADEVIE